MSHHIGGQRTFSPYELNQLIKYGFDPAELADVGDKPVEYITGKVDFRGLTLTVNSDVLIPRVETEELVTHCLHEIAQSTTATTPITVLEIGTGSGAIGLSLAVAWHQQQRLYTLYLTDISEAALAVAQKNAQLLGLPSQSIKYNHGHLWQAAPELKYHLIVANLPYVPTNRITQLDSSVQKYEPHLALDGGPDGLRLIRLLLADVHHYLLPKGVCWLEVDDTHTAKQLSAEFPQLSLSDFSDSFGKTRFIRACLRQ